MDCLKTKDEFQSGMCIILNSSSQNVNIIHGPLMLKSFMKWESTRSLIIVEKKTIFFCAMEWI